MGDVSSHAEIARAVIPLLPPEPAAPFFEIGNWLTDVSQFRDPFAHLSGKKTIFEQGLNSRAALPRVFNLGDLVLRLDNYLDELLGVAPADRAIGRRPGANPAADRPDDGALAKWMRDALLLATCNPRITPVLTHLPVLAALPKDEIKGVFDALFTQYFPHEHLDFPPFPSDHPQRGVREPSTVPVAGEPRRVLAYSEAQLEYVADLLTAIERDWAHVPAAGADPARRRELFARLGHASHAVEDWFFHSNFVELAWHIAHPDQAAPHGPLPLEPTTPAHLEALGPVATDTTLQRRFHRRLREPRFEGNSDVLRRDASEEATRCYTGSFGGDDIFFTLIDALGSRLGATRPPGPASAQAEGLDVLLTALFGTDKERKTALKKWNEGIRNGRWVLAARVLGRLGRLESFEVAAVERMCALEKDLLHRYSFIGLGIVGMMQKIIEKGRVTAKKSRERGVALDEDPARRITDDRSDNDAPGENIGCHSLMCKDSTREEPLRQAAVNCATSVAQYVTKTMVDRTAEKSPARPDDFVDWAELLRFFVTHPAQVPGASATPWWREPLEAASPPGPATGHTVVIVPAADAGPRAEQPHLAPLEQPYYDAAVDAEKRFKTTVDTQLALNSFLTGLVVGGITGMVAGGVDRQGAAIAEGIGLGLVTGATVAGAASVVGAGLGLAINRHAGAAVGSTGGIVGGILAAYFAARALTDHL
ncbi:hypothetical protein [Frankia gtarii]|uniref:hypothetical protein n=1 Tax=Frankia gtarii TaxID=2950102 RepID=UPI0021BE43A3|nr:hypothetical protein [Frankia gtarii]